MAIYNYNNNVSTSTTIVNGTSYTQNVYSLGGSNSCNSGPTYCTDGYSLYFPCLKDITRGQDVCFDFYVADNDTKDVADLRDVDALTLQLSGAFGCTFGTYTYPEDITFLQQEIFELVYENDFGSRELLNLNVIAIDTENNDTLDTRERSFYYGTEVQVSAYDTKDKLFIGWAFGDENIFEECNSLSFEDIIVSTDNTYKFKIEYNCVLFALYRDRKTYHISISQDNNHSYFYVYYNGQKHIIANPKHNKFGSYDYLDILEGYYFVAECVPNIMTYEINDVTDDDYTYNFIKWQDGSNKIIKEFRTGFDTTVYENSDNEILLSAICSEPVSIKDAKNVKNEITPTQNIFNFDIIKIDTPFDDSNIYVEEEEIGDDNLYVINGITHLYFGENGMIKINNGTFLLKDLEIEGGVKIVIYVKPISTGIISVIANELESSIEVNNNEEMYYEFYIDNCNNTDIEVTTFGEFLFDKIEVYKEEIIDKGKAQLCIPKEDTINLPVGQISVSGAISANGSTYGISSTVIGQINKNNKINII